MSRVREGSIAIIDIETTGLDPHTHQILEFACILWDPISGRVSSFERVVWHSCLLGQAIALGMNARLLQILGKAEREDTVGQAGVCSIDTLQSEFLSWLGDNGVVPADGKADKVSLTVCGKNVASFDVPFLKPIFDRIKFRHRVLDIGSVCYDPTIHGSELPSLQECLDFLEIPKQVSHTALDDCSAVLSVLQALYPPQ